MIQILTYDGNKGQLEGNNVVVNSLHDARSLDEFEINIIDLSSSGFWKNWGHSRKTIDEINDFQSVARMIDNSKDTEIVILFPQNTMFTYNMRYEDRRDWERCELKNMIGDLKEILSELYSKIGYLDIVYENTVTNIGNSDVSAAFYFNNIENKVFTRSKKSNKATTIGYGKVILSTLDISCYQEVNDFFKKIGLIKDKQNIPEWMEEIKMFDDNVQFEKIRQNNDIIRSATDAIAEAQAVIDKNMRYKSILYTNGDELVDVIFEILTEMLGCNLSEFEDKKNEDFLFDINGVTFIGEIKGVNHNVKNENVSQLDVHYQKYLDEHEDCDSDNIKAILIMNHQKNKPISDREPIHENQIKLAIRNGSLIIDTMTLLRLFEKYIKQELSRAQCVEILKSNIGFLNM